MNLTIEARHLKTTGPLREYIETKIPKLERYYDGIHSIEVVLDKESSHFLVEIVVTGGRKHTFVASAEHKDMYAGVDGAMNKITQQLRRFKDRVRDRHGPPHGEGA